MKAFIVEITRFLSSDQPGFVECRFFDAWEKEHRVQEKVPVVTSKDLDENSDYPQNGIIACEIIKIWTDKNNRKIYTVTAEKPWDIETIEGLNEFDLLEGQLTEIKR